MFAATSHIPERFRRAGPRLYGRPKARRHRRQCEDGPHRVPQSISLLKRIEITVSWDAFPGRRRVFHGDIRLKRERGSRARAELCHHALERGVDRRRQRLPQAAEALKQLCRTYWYPLYAYVRRSGRNAEDAEDLTQAFFAKLLEKRQLKSAQRERGKFRSFLLTSLKHFLTNEWHRARAEKRGAGAPHFHFDTVEAEQLYLLEPTHALTADILYELSWAMALVERVRARVRQEYVAEGKAERFDAAEQFLPGERSKMTYDQAAQQLGIPEGTIKSDVHRVQVTPLQPGKTSVSEFLTPP